MKKYLVVIILGTLLALTAYGLRSTMHTQTNSDTTTVAVSFYPLYYLTKEIAKDRAEVINITPPGVEPHDYEPTPQDMVFIENSSLLVLNGGGLEPWEDRVTHTNKVIASEGLLTRDLEEDGKRIKDPHVWLDPQKSQGIVDTILTGLVRVDPQNEDYYTKNAIELKNRLGTLDADFQRGLAQCARRDFVTSHDAFGYLAARYNLHPISISGVSPDEEPSSAELIEITKLVKEKNINYIFFETLVSPKLAETLAKETGAQTLVLDPLEGLRQEDIGKGKDYTSVMMDNLANLRIALECK